MLNVVQPGNSCIKRQKAEVSPNQARQQTSFWKCPGSIIAMIFSFKSLRASERNESMSDGKACSLQTLLPGKSQEIAEGSESRNARGGKILS